jgi:hypothetical protein
MAARQVMPARFLLLLSRDLPNQEIKMFLIVLSLILVLAAMPSARAAAAAEASAAAKVPAVAAAKSLAHHLCA